MPNDNRDVEMKFNEDGSLDEVISNNCEFHLEQLSDKQWWMAIRKGNKDVNVTLEITGDRITASWYENVDYVVTPRTEPSATPYNPMRHWSLDDLRRTLDAKEIHRRKAYKDAEELSNYIGEIAKETLNRLNETDANRELVFTYQNHAGITSIRHVRFIGIRWGTSEWYPTPGWLLLAYDIDKGENREFSLNKMKPA